MISLLKNIKDEINIFINIKKISSINPKIIIYSENKAYQKYAFLIIEILSKKYPNQIYYVSSDKEDKVDNHNIENVYIGSKYAFEYFFRSIKAKNMFLTVTDLDNHKIKKNKFVKNYIYFFHAPMSTSKIYTETAFDNFDTVLCNGDYHFNEITSREESLSLKKKNLFKTGYFFFDYLNHYSKNENNLTELLIAPSWNKDKTNFLNENFESIIDILLKSNFKVRFRPHPEIIKRSKFLMDYYKKKFKGDNFIFDEDPNNLDAMRNSKCLITDNSGISIEYTLVFKRPVIYFNDFDKIHNINFKHIKNLPLMENSVKESFGYFFNKDEIKNLSRIITNSISDFRGKNEMINSFINKNFYNFSNTKNFLNENITKIII
jgi:hypothetical protein